MLVDQLTSSAQGAGTAGTSGGHSRRSFLKIGAAAGGGLLLSISLRGAPAATFEAEAQEFAPNAYVRVGRDGKVSLIVAQVEMGQGTFTSMPMLIAEELEVDLADVRVEQAPPNDKLYANPLLGFQATGGSTSVRAFWKPLREAGAVGAHLADQGRRRYMGRRSERPQRGKGRSRRQGLGPEARSMARSLDKAATYPVPDKVALKRSEGFQAHRNAGEAPRHAVQGRWLGQIRHRRAVAGPQYLRRSRRARCSAASLKASTTARRSAVKGVRQIVKLDDVVAVIADHNGAARKGLAALDITWDDGPNAHFSSADLVAELEQAAKTDGVVATKEGDVAQAIGAAAHRIEAVYSSRCLLMPRSSR